MMGTSFNETSFDEVDIMTANNNASLSLASRLAQGGELALWLSINSSVTDLQQDLVIKKGSSVFLDGSGRTLNVVLFQIRVENGAQLCIYNLTMAGSGSLSDANMIMVGKDNGPASLTPSQMRTPSQIAVPIHTTKLDVGWMTFRDHWASTHTVDGGAVALVPDGLLTRSAGKAFMSFSWCQFVNNRGGAGGGIFAASGLVTIDHCEFFDNQANEFGGVSGGGAVCLERYASARVTSSTFVGNRAATAYGGGGILIFAGSVVIQNCHFSANKATVGGALSIKFGTKSSRTISDVDVTATQCLDRKDSSIYGTTCRESKPYCTRGGINFRLPDQTNALACPATCRTCLKKKALISHSSFSHNQAAKFGGAMYIDNADAIVLHTQFSDNTAKGRGLHLYAKRDVIYSDQNFLKVQEYRQLTVGNCHFDSSFVSAEYAGTAMIDVWNLKARFQQCHIEAPSVLPSKQKFGKNAFLKSTSFAEFTLTQSTVRFRNAAQMSLANALLRLTGNNFTGSGEIHAGEGKHLSGVEEISVLANTFDGVLLKMGDVTSTKVQIRNNKGMALNATDSAFQTCHAVNGGFAAGCDIRAACQAEGPPWNIQCSCEKSGLLAANVTEDAGLVGSKDGSKCVQPQVFKVAATTAQIRLIVKKPDNSSSQFQILAQGDETFNVFVEVIYGKSSTKKYLSVDALTCMLRRSGLLAMSLPGAKAEKSCTFTIRAVGLLTNWGDQEEREAVCECRMAMWPAI